MLLPAPGTAQDGLAGAVDAQVHGRSGAGRGGSSIAAAADADAAGTGVQRRSQPFRIVDDGQVLHELVRFVVEQPPLLRQHLPTPPTPRQWASGS